MKELDFKPELKKREYLLNKANSRIFKKEDYDSEMIKDTVNQSHAMDKNFEKAFIMGDAM